MSSNYLKRKSYHKQRKAQKKYEINKRKKIINELVRKYGLRCWYCGIELTNRKIEIDHIIPKSKGGSDDLYNLALACKICNVKMLNYDKIEYLRHLAHIRSSEFSCPILTEYRKELFPHEQDKLQKSFF